MMHYAAVNELPDNGRIVVYRKNGTTTFTKVLRDDEHIATLRVFMELAESAGYYLACDKKM